MTSCAFTRGESNSGRESDFGTTPVLNQCDNLLQAIVLFYMFSLNFRL